MFENPWGRQRSWSKVQGLFYFDLLETDGECVDFHPKIFLLYDIETMYIVKVIFIIFFSFCFQLTKKLISN